MEIWTSVEEKESLVTSLEPKHTSRIGPEINKAGQLQDDRAFRKSDQAQKIEARKLWKAELIRSFS